MPRPVHHVLDGARSYQGVQEQLLGLIDSQLPGPPPTRGAHLPGALNFCLFIRPQADVVMSHGVADRNYLWTRDARGQRIANQRSHLLVPGQWLKRRLLASPSIQLGRDQVHVVGWPRLDVLASQLRPPSSRRMRDARLREGRPRVLWAPTHDGRTRGEAGLSTSSFPAFGNYLSALSRFAWVDVSVHPRNRTDRTPTGASLPMSDVVVADPGSTAYEAWALGKPVIFPRWLLTERIAERLPDSAEAHIVSERIGYHPESFDEFVDILRAGPVVGPEVQAFMDDYLEPAYFGRSSARVAEVLTRLAER